ncbi:MAG: hypothetical protein JW807_00935 [Spirochaetes bacterium]|nr:hypothetical protein [Spirochaetota bacterium]
MKDALVKFISQCIDKSRRETIVGCIGRIEKHDTQTMRADVKPLLKYMATGETVAKEFQVLPDIPVQFLWAGGYYIRPKYQNGDLVWVTFATHEIQRGLKGSPDSISGRLFSLENASVAHGISKTNWSPPAEFSKDGLLIGHKDGNFYFHIQDDQVKIKGNVEIDGSLKTTGKIETDSDISASGKIETDSDIAAHGKIEADLQVTAMKSTSGVNLSTHIHPYVDTPVGASNTSPPTPGT